MGSRAQRNTSIPVLAALVATALACDVLTAGSALPPAGPATRPASTPPDLFRAIAAQDTALFDAYNRCDLETFASLLDDNIEFYHDHGGVTRGSKELTLSVKQNICGRTTRELVPGSLEVYPMDNYGALEIGVHRFHHTGGDSSQPIGEGKFIHLWQYDKQARTWKVTRVISFDHHEIAAAPGTD